MNDLVLQENQDGIAIITLNRVAHHNSLNLDFIRAIERAISAQIKTQPKAMVLCANGKVFSTGGDMKAFKAHLDNPKPYAHDLVGSLNRVLMMMLHCPCPIITAVAGTVTGGSMGFVLAADMVLLGPRANFTPWYTAVGFSPDGGWTALLPRLIPRHKANEILLLNRTINATQALVLGLANDVVDIGDVNVAALTWAREAARLKTGSIQLTKRLALFDLDAIELNLEEERTHFVAQIQTAEARQGILDFVDGKHK